MKEDKKALSVQDICKDLSVGEETVRYWVNSGKLPALKLPGKGSQAIVRVTAEAYREFRKVYSK